MENNDSEKEAIKKELEGILKFYDYKKDRERTEKAVRDWVQDRGVKIREMLLDILELIYAEGDERLISVIEEVKDKIDVIIDYMDYKRVVKKDNLEEIMEEDEILIKNMKAIYDKIREIKSGVLEGEYTRKEIIEIAEELKMLIENLREEMI